MFIFEYAKLVGPNQETEYNIARSFHLIGLTHLAIPHYEKVLCMPSKAKSSVKKQKPIDDVYKWPLTGEELAEWEQEIDDDDETDIKHEAAYNLHLIYITSGSMNLAQILLLKYCTI
jgi:general transcription factor 3C polypeptide 3 (transcription factor C subunit 4)